jgi:hypothetical protein
MLGKRASKVRRTIRNDSSRSGTTLPPLGHTEIRICAVGAESPIHMASRAAVLVLMLLQNPNRTAKRYGLRRERLRHGGGRFGLHSPGAAAARRRRPSA